MSKKQTKKIGPSLWTKDGELYIGPSNPKSDIVKKVAKKYGYTYIGVKPAKVKSDDLKGIPCFVDNQTKAKTKAQKIIDGEDISYPYLCSYNFNELWQIIDELSKIVTKDNFANVTKFADKLDIHDNYTVIRKCLTTNNELSNTKAFLEWAIKHQNYLFKVYDYKD